MAASKKKSDERQVAAAPAARANAGQAASSVIGSSGLSGSGLGGSELSGCELALARVIQGARALAQDNGETRGRLPSGRTRTAGDQTGATEHGQPASGADELAALFRELDPETALKIRTLMIAGRDGQSIPGVNVNLSLADSDAGFAAMAADSSDNGPLLIEYLLRGHAIACAAGIDLDLPLERWQTPSSDDLDERAWLSFGRQLATSAPSEWQCISVVEPRTRELSKLYLRLGDRAWWSFQTLLDRPTPAGVEKERRLLARRKLKGVPADSLEGVVGSLARVRGRALRRAGRAICARLGQSSSPIET